ncbi:MAG: polyprenyl synthetase family protein, partial [Bacillota bacterium]
MNDWAGKLKTLVDEALEDTLPAESVPPELLHRAMRYAVFPGGKRIRPLLVFSAALAVSRHRLSQNHNSHTAVRRAVPCAVAVELVHSYSLIHDDLPAMDNDDYRRGRPTVHKVFGEALAILAGDALLPLAFEVLSDSNARELLGPEAACACASELARAAGSLGMAGGQGIDASPPGADASLGLVEKLADLKTGALIRASVRCGAIAAGAGARELDALTRFAELFGRAFQVFDD